MLRNPGVSPCMDGPQKKVQSSTPNNFVFLGGGSRLLCAIDDPKYWDMK